MDLAESFLPVGLGECPGVDLNESSMDMMNYQRKISIEGLLEWRFSIHGDKVNGMIEYIRNKQEP
jgi:hypothetical protein